MSEKTHYKAVNSDQVQRVHAAGWWAVLFGLLSFCNNGMAEEFGRNREKGGDGVVTRSLLTPNLRDFKVAFFPSIRNSEVAHGKLWGEFVILLNEWQVIYSWVLFPLSFSQRAHVRMIAVWFHILCVHAGLSYVSFVFYSSGAAFWVYVFFFLSFIFFQLFIWRLLDAFFFSLP